jgi:hypothetical protein
VKLPNCDRAVVDLVKLRDYCLSKVHPRGKHKARVFRAALGLTVEDTEELWQALLDAAWTSEATKGEADQWGQRYTLDFQMTRAGRSAWVRSGWIVLAREDFPRLTSCYVVEE